MNMDTKVLLMIAIEIVVIALLLLISKKNKFIEKNKALFTIIFGVFVSTQIFTTIMLLIVAGVFKPSPTLTERSSVQDPSSKTLSILLTREDMPSNWKWETIETYQPSNLPWIEPQVMESSSIFFAAKVPHSLIFKHYVRLEHVVQYFGSPLSELEFNKQILMKGEDSTAFAPNLNQKGKYFYSMCGMGSDYYSCDISMGYDYIISSIWMMTPEELGKQYMIDLLNSAIALTDQRIQKISQ